MEKKIELFYTFKNLEDYGDSDTNNLPPMWEEGGITKPTVLQLWIHKEDSHHWNRVPKLSEMENHKKISTNTQRRHQNLRFHWSSGKIYTQGQPLESSLGISKVNHLTRFVREEHEIEITHTKTTKEGLRDVSIFFNAESHKKLNQSHIEIHAINIWESNLLRQQSIDTWYTIDNSYVEDKQCDFPSPLPYGNKGIAHLTMNEIYYYKKSRFIKVPTWPKLE